MATVFASAKPDQASVGITDYRRVVELKKNGDG